MENPRVSDYANEIVDIISILTEEEIKSLAITITGGLLRTKIRSREDTVKVILRYSDDIRSILRRKVFTREKLLSYLYDKNVSVKLPITKPDIIEKILHFWTNKISETQTNTERDSTNNSVGCSQLTSYKTETNGRSQQEITEKSTTAEVSPIEEKTNQEIVTRTTAEQESSDIEKRQQDDVDVKKTVRVLATQFSEWFYKLLNKNELTPEHFFPDGVLNLKLLFNGDTNCKMVCNDPAALTGTLVGIKNQYNLFFNPNLIEDGIEAEMDPHGLVIVMVRGTLHINHMNSICVGVFEQMFALARDPFSENNWKVKRTDLCLTNGSKLVNSGITSADSLYTAIT